MKSLPIEIAQSSDRLPPQESPGRKPEPRRPDPPMDGFPAGGHPNQSVIDTFRQRP